MSESAVYFDDECDPDEIGKAKFDRAMPGKYHAKVASHEINDNGNHEFTFNVVAGKPHNPQHGDQRGHQVKLYVSQEFKKIPRQMLGQLSLCLGLVSREQAREAKAAGTGIAIDWSQSVGRHCGILVTEDTYNGEQRSRINWPNHVFALDSDDAKGMEIDREALKVTSDPFGGASAPAAPAETQPQAEPQAAAGKSLF